MIIKRTIKGDCEQLHAHKCVNLVNWFNFLNTQTSKTHTLQVNNMNSHISIKEIEPMTNNNLPKLKEPGLNGATRGFSQTLKEEFMPTLYTLFQKIEKKEYFITHSMKSELP